MQVHKLDHVNIHTADVDRMVEWYDRVLGMPAGDRPPFSFPGAWLYCGGQPTVHLVGVEAQPAKRAACSWSTSPSQPRGSRASWIA